MVANRLAGKRVRSTVAICVLALALPACSTMQDFAGIERPGYQKDGSYILTAQEHDTGCRALQERSQSLQAQMTSLSERAVEEVQQVPATIANAWGRLFGSPGDGVPAVAQYNAARAESTAVNAALTRKGCSGLDTASIKN
jgi:hypothetical protein